VKIVFFGLGSIGKRHLAIIQREYPDFELFHFYTHAAFPGIQEIHGWSGLEKIKPDVAFICNPTNYHIDTALRCAKMGSNLFIEKPLGIETGSKLNNLLHIVEQQGLTAYVAYPFRHSVQINRFKKKLQKKIKTARIVCRTDVACWGKEYSRKAASGGGAIFELSHEIDYAQFLFGPIVSMGGIAVHCSNGFTDAETNAVINCFHSDFVTRIELNLLSDVNERFIEYGDTKLDLTVSSQMYSDQIRYFFGNIGNPKIENNIFEAAALFEKIVELKRGNTHCLH
jgi:predicted dehydrogenase